MPSAATSRNGALALPAPQVERIILELPNAQTAGQTVGETAVQTPGVSRVGELQNPPNVAHLYSELKSEQQKTEALLGKDKTKLLPDILQAAHSEGLETLMRTRRTHILAERDADAPSGATASREKVEQQICRHCLDRIERFRSLNKLIESGAIDLDLLGKIKESGSKEQYRAARNEILELFAGGSVQREVRFILPRPDNARPSGVIRAGTGEGPEANLSAEQLLSGKRDLRTSLIAVQGEFARLKACFPQSADFERVLVWSGAQSIEYQLGVHASKGMLLSVTSDPGQREALAKDQLKAERTIGNLSVDFIERSEALRKLLANPNARAKLFEDMTPSTRLAYERHLRHGGGGEEATRYDKSVRQLIALLNMSPEQIEAAAKMHPQPPMSPPLSPGSPYQHSGGNRGVVPKSAAVAGREMKLDSEVAPGASATPPSRKDFSQLPYVNPQSALLRERAYHRCVFEMQEVVKVALGPRMFSPTADKLPPSQSMLVLAANTHRVQDYDLGDDRGALKMANQTNSILAQARNLEGPLRSLSDLRDDFQQKLDLAKKSKMALPDFEREVLKLRDECVEKAKKIIAQELPMFQGEALPLQEMILPKRDLEKLLKERPSAVVLPPVTSPLVSPLLPSRELPTPAIGSPALGSPPPKKLEALEPISVQRQSPVLNTENRMALQRLAACETSLIHIHGTVNGEPLYVGYDTVKQRIISDAASAERMGVRFLDTGEKGPNGLPKIQVEFTLPGQFSAEYNGVNLRTAARWSGSVSSPTPLQKNMARLEEAQNLGKDRWHKDMQSAARVPDGTKYHYAYSSEDARLYARSPDGKSTLAFDPQKNSWHSVSPAKLPPCLQGGGTPSGLAV